MSFYEILVLGEVPRAQFADLSMRIAAGVQPFGLHIGREVQIRTATDQADRDPKCSTVVAFFAGPSLTDNDLALRLQSRGIPLIPVIQRDATFSLLPGQLAVPNGIKLSSDADMQTLASALLESAGLMRQQRRVFISYRQSESREAAVQLHDILVEHGFDTFLDTHSIRPGEPFQDVLWHRMTDSDVVIMLDTETYFDGRWTREEFGKALAKEVHILRLVWPGRLPTRHLSAGETVQLSAADLTAAKTLVKPVVDELIATVERIRSRSIAARFRTLTGKLRAEMERIGAVFEGVGAHHAIAIRLPGGRRLWAYPAVGVPTAKSLNEIAERAIELGDGDPILIYDHAGIHENWVRHLDWLDSNLPVVDAVKVFEAGLRLAELDS